MPDSTKQSISATQVPALFNASPYLTKFMLYRWFKYGDEVISPTNNRMDWGLLLEPLCLAQAGKDLFFDVRPTRREDGTQPYVRNGLIGCTRDAEIICPDRGPGALETKCVFDYGTWMREWDGGKKPPRHHELQLQSQMFVGDGFNSFKWGVLAAWCGGEMKYFERKPMPDLWKAMEVEAAKFFADLEAEREPDPFGAAIELPLLAKVFPTEIGSELDLSKFDPASKEFGDALAYAESARMMNWHDAERLGHDRAAKALKARLFALAKSNERVLLPHGISVTVSQSPRAGCTVNPSVTTSLKAFVPDNLPEGDLSVFDNAEIGG